MRGELAEGEELLDGIEAFPCDVSSLFLEGICRHYDLGRVGDGLAGFLERYPSLRKSVAEVARNFGVDAAGQRMLRLIDGKTSLGQLWQGGDLDSLFAGQLLLALKGADALVFGDAPVEKSFEIPASDLTPPVPRRPLTKKRAAPPAKRPSFAAKPGGEKKSRMSAEAAFRQAKTLLKKNALAKALNIPEMKFSVMW